MFCLSLRKLSFFSLQYTCCWYNLICKTIKILNFFFDNESKTVDTDMTYCNLFDCCIFFFNKNISLSQSLPFSRTRLSSFYDGPCLTSSVGTPMACAVCLNWVPSTLNFAVILCRFSLCPEKKTMWCALIGEPPNCWKLWVKPFFLLL